MVLEDCRKWALSVVGDVLRRKGPENQLNEARLWCILAA